MKFGLKRETLETEGGREVRFLLVCGRKTQTAVYPSSPRNPPGFLTVLYSWLFLYSVYRWMSDQHRNRRIDTSVNIAEVENCVNKETKFHYNLCCGLFFFCFFASSSSIWTFLLLRGELEQFLSMWGWSRPWPVDQFFTWFLKDKTTFHTLIWYSFSSIDVYIQSVSLRTVNVSEIVYFSDRKFVV